MVRDTNVRFGENEKEDVDRTLTKRYGSWNNAPIIEEKTVSKLERGTKRSRGKHQGKIE